jgi:DNA-binding MarR family transcriptional regulator
MKASTYKPDVQLLSDYDIWGLAADTVELLGKARNMELSRHGLSREQSHILRVLYEAGRSLTINEMLSRVFRRHNSVSAILKRMEKKGLVERTKVPDDRQYEISITTKGRDLFETMPRNSIRMAFSVISNEEKRMFGMTLTKLNQKVRNMIGLDYSPPFLT